MMNAIIISGVVIGLEAVALWVLGKSTKDLTDEQIQELMKEIQEAQYKRFM